MKGGAYLSCYSCPHSEVFTNDKRKAVKCRLYNKIFRLKPGMSFPDFCGIKAVNNKKGKQK